MREAHVACCFDDEMVAAIIPASSLGESVRAAKDQATPTGSVPASKGIGSKSFERLG